MTNTATEGAGPGGVLRLTWVADRLTHGLGLLCACRRYGRRPAGRRGLLLTAQPAGDKSGACSRAVADPAPQPACRAPSGGSA
jgi:hypothetical protein